MSQNSTTVHHLKAKGSKMEKVGPGGIATEIVEGDPAERLRGNYKKGAKSPSLEDMMKEFGPANWAR